MRKDKFLEEVVGTVRGAEGEYTVVIVRGVRGEPYFADAETAEARI